jgi:hypothetical protein
MPSRRATAVGVVAALGLILVVLLVGGLTTQSRLVATVGVLPVFPVAPLAAGNEVCQTPIGLADPVERVRFNIGTFGRPGPPLEVTVHPANSGIDLGHGRVAAGWIDDGSAQDVPVGHIADDQRVSVCIRNLGRTKAYVYGDLYEGIFGTGPLGVRPTALTSYAAIDRVRIPGDLSLKFVSAKPRSLLSRLPAAFRHASLFRPGWVGPWTYWLLAALILLAAPFALRKALSRAYD